MVQPGEAADLAAFLRQLKARTDRSYEALANRVGVSSSSLHRYCSGSAVPPDYAVVDRLGRVCGATREDLRELRRLWLAAATPVTTEPTAAADPRAATSGPQAARADRPQPVLSEHRREEPITAIPGRSGDPGPAAPTVERGTRHARRPSSRTLAAVFTTIVAAATVAVFPRLATGDAQYAAGVDRDQPLLLSRACPAVLGLGQRDECVRELQRLLRNAGLRIDAEGHLDAQTRRQVTVFQVLAGLPANSIVDVGTKRALYAGTVHVRTVPPAQVERMIRETFSEDPEAALAIARCQSGLDPVSVESREEDGTRLWGLFRIADPLVTELGGTPKLALDVTWNIQAARQLWGRTQSFGSWKPCTLPRGTGPRLVP